MLTASESCKRSRLWHLMQVGQVRVVKTLTAERFAVMESVLARMNNITTTGAKMADWECPHCGTEYAGTGDTEQDCGERTCDECGERYRVVVEYEATYYAEVVSTDELKHEPIIDRCTTCGIALNDDGTCDDCFIRSWNDGGRR